MKKWLQWLAITLKASKIIVVFKVVKAGKVLVLVGSMAASIIAYAFATGSWSFGLGLVGLLLVHELGHVEAARRCGIDASWPIFIPFVGAAIFIKKFSSMRSEAFVAIAGPVVGTAGALILLIPYLLTGDKIWAGLVYLGLILNTFNMIPLKPLDGGRMTVICGRWFRVIGFVLLGGLSIIVREPVMLYVWVIVLSDITFPQWWRTAVSVLLSGSMMILMATGFSSQVWWADICDCVVVIFVSFSYFATEQGVAKGAPDPFLETFDDDDSIYLQERVAWAIGWLSMCSFLSIALWFVHDAAGGFQ